MSPKYYSLCHFLVIAQFDTTNVNHCLLIIFVSPKYYSLCHFLVIAQIDTTNVNHCLLIIFVSPKYYSLCHFLVIVQLDTPTLIIVYLSFLCHLNIAHYFISLLLHNLTTNVNHCLLFPFCGTNSRQNCDFIMSFPYYYNQRK